MYVYSRNLVFDGRCL